AAQAKEAERAQQDAATGEEIADSVEDTASELTAEEVELARQKAEREAVKAERAAEKARLKAEREAEKGAEAQAKEVAKAEREAEKAAAAQAKEVEKAKSVKENDATRAKDEPADRDAEEAAAAREAEKAAAAREKELEKAAREKEKTAQAKEREKEKAAAARTKEIERAKSDAEKQRNKPAPRQVASRSGAAGVPAFSLRTNLLHWLALVPNAGFEWRVSRTVGVRLDGGWSGWEAGKGISAKYHRLFYANPEVRFYFSAQSKFYLGVGGTMGQFNIKLGDKTGYQGDAWGASASAGYMLRLTRALSMDFNIGLGYMDFRYDTFRTDEDGMRIYKLKNRHSGLFGPTQCGVTLVWRLGRR
ncbi:DUF3575 domain-containing protein, partial [Alistipes sp. OttesenSCG-928-B03]|nr:DUF3575 domain-containing protein [Alistipes sp. OttesenSCG-928-B03]